jgi:hypothetical protein
MSHFGVISCELYYKRVTIIAKATYNINVLQSQFTLRAKVARVVDDTPIVMLKIVTSLTIIIYDHKKVQYTGMFGSGNSTLV